MLSLKFISFINNNWCFIVLCLVDAAKEALTDMPPRGEEELDPVTLHNQALMNMETHPTEGFEKLQFLIQQNPFPPETFGNLLLLYCKHEVQIYYLTVLIKFQNFFFLIKNNFLYFNQISLTVSCNLVASPFISFSCENSYSF